MKGSRVAARYAKSMIQLAKEQGSLEKVYGDMKDIKGTIHSNDELDIVLKSPLIKSEKKKQILVAIFKSTEKLTKSLLEQLVSQNREMHLELVASEFIAQYNVLKGIVIAKVTSAKQISDKDLKTLSASIKEQFNCSEVVIEEKIDEALLGGMIVRIGDKQIDDSIDRRIKDLKNELIQA